MSKEGYSQKGCTAYHGEPLGSATKEQPKKVSQTPAPYKGKITSYQGEPHTTLSNGKNKKDKEVG